MAPIPGVHIYVRTRTYTYRYITYSLSCGTNLRPNASCGFTFRGLINGTNFKRLAAVAQIWHQAITGLRVMLPPYVTAFALTNKGLSVMLPPNLTAFALTNKGLRVMLPPNLTA